MVYTTKVISYSYCTSMWIDQELYLKNPPTLPTQWHQLMERPSSGSTNGGHSKRKWSDKLDLNLVSYLEVSSYCLLTVHWQTQVTCPPHSKKVGKCNPTLCSVGGPEIDGELHQRPQVEFEEKLMVSNWVKSSVIFLFSLDQSFSTSATETWGWIILCCVGLPWAVQDG